MGDAMTNFLCIEMILAYMQMRITEWSDLYDDLPCANTKIECLKKDIIKVVKTEDYITFPKDL